MSRLWNTLRWMAGSMHWTAGAVWNNFRLLAMLGVMGGAGYTAYRGIENASKPKAPPPPTPVFAGVQAPDAAPPELAAPPASAAPLYGANSFSSSPPVASASLNDGSFGPPGGNGSASPFSTPALAAPEPPPENPYRNLSPQPPDASLAAAQAPAEQPGAAAIPTPLPSSDPYSAPAAPFSPSAPFGAPPAQPFAGPPAAFAPQPAPPSDPNPPSQLPPSVAAQPMQPESGGFGPAPPPASFGPPVVEPAPAPALAETSPAPAPLANPYGAAPEAPLPAAEPAPGGYNPAPRTRAAAGMAGQGVPGDRQLEGSQTPAVTIEKLAPAEIQVGKPARFELRVRNSGQVPAHEVVITDHVPKGTQLVDTLPAAERATDGGLAWALGTLAPGQETTLAMNVMPESEGEIGSVAQVAFVAQATARTVCTRPLLAIEHTAPAKVQAGEMLTLAITVSNPGTGAATGVIIEEDVPEGLSHVAGAQLEYEIGTLRPGESRRMELTMRAEKAGQVRNTILVRGDGNLSAKHQAQIEVIAPQLAVEIQGPKRRFLQRPAAYSLAISNPGTAAARDIELAAYLPRGMKFVDADSQGQYDPQQHAVYWSLAELPPQRAGNVKLSLMPIEAGEQKLRLEGRGAPNLTIAQEQAVLVEAAAELVHTITDLADPIEVGADTTYEIRLVNTGTKTATNVRVTAVLPAEFKPIGGDGPTRAANDGQKIVFEPIARLNPQEDAVFKVQAQGLREGDHLIRVQISSDEWPTPVTREESTRVYIDR